MFCLLREKNEKFPKNSFFIRKSCRILCSKLCFFFKVIFVYSKFIFINKKKSLSTLCASRCFSSTLFLLVAGDIMAKIFFIMLSILWLYYARVYGYVYVYNLLYFARDCDDRCSTNAIPFKFKLLE